MTENALQVLQISLKVIWSVRHSYIRAQVSRVISSQLLSTTCTGRIQAF